MDPKTTIILCSVLGALTFALFVVWLVFFILRKINPSWKLKHVDLQKGLILELTNKKDTEVTVRSFHLYVTFPGINGEAHTNLLDYVMQPNEVIEIPMKIHAGKVPEVGSKVTYTNSIGMRLGYFRIKTNSVGRIDVISTGGDAMKPEGIYISAGRSS